jgi:hypothetical protein
MPFHRRKLYFILLQFSYQLNLFRIEAMADDSGESFVVELQAKTECGGAGWGCQLVCRSIQLLVGTV